MTVLWPRRLLIGAVRAYQLLLSAWLGPSCRFEPSCSHYALEALHRHGALAGSALTLGRVVRCAPWCAGGHDPVPLKLPSLVCLAVPLEVPRLFRHLTAGHRPQPPTEPTARAEPPARALP